MKTQAFDLQYRTLLASFEEVAQIASPLKRRFVLNLVAPWHNLPKSEIRKLFELFLIEKASISK